MIDVQPPEPGSGKSRRRWGAAVVAALILVAGGVTVAVWTAGRASSADAIAAPVTSPAAVDPVKAVVLPRPDAAAPNSDWQGWVGQETAAILKRQTAALLGDDFPAYLRDSVPAAKVELGRRFRSLRSLHVTRFDQRADGSPWPPERAGGDWRVVTVADHCFVEKDCAADAAVFDTMWRVTAEGVRFTGFRVHNRAAPCYKCPIGTQILTRPWETTELTAQVGRRTLVAVPIADRARLAELSRHAEAAATIADRYTVGAGRVDRYRVFVADPASWKLWYEGSPGTWVAGQAVPTGRDRIETSVLIGELTSRYTDRLLRHELAHVSTLRNNTYYGRGDVWWLVEGMAEHVKQNGDAAGERPDLHRFLRSHRLTSIAVGRPAAQASTAEANGRYAVGFFALEHLIATYGRPAALAFFQLAVQQGIGLDTASRSALHKPWAQVDRECTAAVRRA